MTAGIEQTRPTRRRRAPKGDGDQLRAEIVTAAKQLLAVAADVDAVSIRAVADAVGVTPPSIYLHFADKAALLTAVVADVFTELDAAMTAAGAAFEHPLARLRAHGLAYVDFAMAHPEHYRVATMLPCPADNPLDEVLASSAFTHFNETVAACMAAGIFPEGDPLPITLDLWSAAHGIASLLVIKPYLPWGDPREVADRILCAAALGHAAAALIPGLGPDREPDEVARWLAEQGAGRPS